MLGSLTTVLQERIAAFRSGGVKGLLGTVGIRVGKTTTPPSSGLVLTTEVFPNFDLAEYQSVLTRWPAYMRAGDCIDLYDSTPQGTISTINQQAAALKAAMPAGVVYSQNSVCPPNYQFAAANVSALITEIAATYEPVGANQSNGCGGTFDFPTCLAYFKALNTVAHSYGKKSIAYPTGDPLWRTDRLQYNWDYGQIAAEVDLLKVEIDSIATDPTTLDQVLAKLVSQMKGQSQPLSKLSVQYDIGSNAQGTFFTDVPSLVAAVQAAQAAGVNGIYLWVTGGGYEDLAYQCVQALRS